MLGFRCVFSLPVSKRQVLVGLFRPIESAKDLGRLSLSGWIVISCQLYIFKVSQFERLCGQTNDCVLVEDTVHSRVVLAPSTGLLLSVIKPLIVGISVKVPALNIRH